jgi:hypothetical protein
MNVRIQYNTEFLAGVYSDHQLILNSYRVSMLLTTQTTDAIEMNIAMERLKCFVFAELADTVFIHQQHADVAELLQIVGMNITTLPEEPVDQIIGMALYCKLNAVMEGRIVISELDISSDDSNGVTYLHDNDESIGPFSTDGWWHQSDTAHNNIDITKLTDKVVKVVKTGALSKAVKLTGIGATAGAKAAIEAAGGSLA